MDFLYRKVSQIMEERRDHKIYKYTNVVNGKVYIGRTCQTLNRRAGHKGNHYKNCLYFWRAIQKYGWENFEGEIIESNLTANEASQREIFWISTYNSTNQKIGYNIHDKESNDYDWEVRHKMSTSHIGKKLSKESIEKRKKSMPDRHGKNNPMYGKKLSEERKTQISEFLRSRPVSEETREKLRVANVGEKNPMYGKHMSVENKRKRGKKVVNLDTGEIFHTTMEAAEYYNLPYKEAIGDCCRGKQKNAGGFRWQYLEKLDNVENLEYNKDIDLKKIREGESK